MATRYRSQKIDWQKKDPIIIRLLGEGMSARSIADKMKLHHSTVSNHINLLTKQGKITRDRRAESSVWSPFQLSTIAAEYESEDCDTSELSQRLGMTIRSLHAVAKRLGLVRSEVAAQKQRSKAMLELHRKNRLLQNFEDPKETKSKHVKVPKEIRSQFGVLVRLPLTGGVEYYDAKYRKTTRIGDPTDAEMERCMRWMAAQDTGQQMAMEVV